MYAASPHFFVSVPLGWQLNHPIPGQPDPDTPDLPHEPDLPPPPGVPTIPDEPPPAPIASH